jgi:G:T-mismatch repair DNA endonuclease (very short patch repair protein)
MAFNGISGCKYATSPKSNMAFWTKKFERNVSNDLKAAALKTQSVPY